MIALLKIATVLLMDALRFVLDSMRSRRALAAENLFLRRQLALYEERGQKARCIDVATRASLAWLSRLCDWRSALVVVRPETLVRWHRAGWRLLWCFKSRPGRPPIPLELRRLIRRMATENPSWGEERIANEPLLKLALRVSPRTVRKNMPKRPPGCPRDDQRWSTFLRNHAKAVIACDFFVAVTATFRMLYVFVVIHHCSRRLVHFNVTEHPTSAWTLQQLREAVGYEGCYLYLIHDRDCIFAKSLDQSIARLGMTILKSAPQSPMANTIGERVIGTIRRECLDWLIPISETHAFAAQRMGYPLQPIAPSHGARTGVPDPPAATLAPSTRQSRHRIDAGLCRRRLRRDSSLLFVVPVIRHEETIRIISARQATSQERKRYEDA